MTSTPDRIRVLLQNHTAENKAFHASEAMWREAIARRPALAGRIEARIGDTADDFAREIAASHVLFAASAEVKARFPCAAPNLRLIFCTSAGLDRLAPYDWLPKGVALLNNSGVHAHKAGDWCLMAILMLVNNMARFATAQREKRWDKTFSGVAAGRTLVVVGLGDIGGTAAARARLFGLKVVGVRARPAPHPACDEVVGADKLDAVLPRADVLLLAAPLTPETKGMLSRARLALMKPSAGLVNIGRGGLVDQEAMCDALDAGKLAGAVLDVFTPEPLPADSRVWTTRNLVVSPHVAADNPATYTPLSIELLLDNLAAWIDGKKLPNQIDPARWY
jgi:phosphoglycerate dehydrogenase-like enzyme